MRAHDAIIRILDAEGVDTVFSLMSGDTKRLLSKLWRDEEEFRVVETRHEQNAVGMADGYARVSGDIGVCFIGRGPGIAQTGTSLLTTYRRGSRVLVFVPGPRSSAIHDIKEFEQTAYLRTMFDDDAVVTVESDDTLIPEVSDVFRRLRVGEGPIAVQIPWDVLDGEIEMDHDDIIDSIEAATGREVATEQRVELRPDPERIEAAVELYLDSDASVPPVIIAGRGAVRADARSAIERLAERMGAMIATTLQGRGYFSGHPYAVGFVGNYGHNLANEFLGRCDYVLAIGCSLNRHTVDRGRLVREEATLIHVDADPSSIDRYTPVDLGVVGDARAVASQLGETLEQEGIDFSETFWTDRRRNRIADSKSLDDRQLHECTDRMDPRTVVRFLDSTLPEDRLVITDGGHHTNWVLDGINIPDPGSVVWTLDFAAVGQALPIGVGGALAADARNCVAFCGDAGFMMVLQEVDTAVRLDAPIVVVVMNDDALGSEYHQLNLVDECADAAIVGSPDIETVARGLGAESHTARSIDDLEGIADELRGPRETPLVVNCLINHEVRHRSYDELFSGVY